MSNQTGAATAETVAQDRNNNQEPTDEELQSILFPKAQRPAAKAASGEDEEVLDHQEDGESDPDLEDDGDGEQPAAEAEASEQGEEAEEGQDAEAEAEGEEGQEESEGEETEGEEQSDAADELDEEDRKTRAKFTPAQQKLFDKAIQKKARKAAEFKAQLEEKEQSLTQLQQELEQARKTPPAPLAPTAENPLLDVTDEAALEQRIGKARAARRWALAHPNGGIVKDASGAENEISAERVGEILAETEELIQEHAPKRREFIRAAKTADLEAEASYPWLKNKATVGAVAVEEALRTYPQLKALIPDVRLALADMFIGRNIRLAQKQQQGAQKGAGKPGLGKPGSTKAPAKAPASPAGNSRPARVQAAVTQKAGAKRKLEETGADPDNEALLSILKST